MCFDIFRLAFFPICRDSLLLTLSKLNAKAHSCAKRRRKAQSQVPKDKRTRAWNKVIGSVFMRELYEEWK